MGPQITRQYLIEGHHLGLDRAVLSDVMPEATLNPATAAQASEFRSHEVRYFCSSIRDNTGQGGDKGYGGFCPVKTVFLAGGIKGPCQEVGLFSQTTEKGCPGMECQQTSSRTNTE